MNTDKAVLDYYNIQAVSVYYCLPTPLISFWLIHVSVKLYKWWTPGILKPYPTAPYPTRHMHAQDNPTHTYL